MDNEMTFERVEVGSAFIRRELKREDPFDLLSREEILSLGTEYIRRVRNGNKGRELRFH